MKKRVREIRERLKMTQAQFAEALGYKTMMTISRWERGVETPNKRAIESMERLLAEADRDAFTDASTTEAESDADNADLRPMTPEEHQTLLEHEAVIEKGLQTFNEVGQALLAIRDGKLYRGTHKSFETYCQERWGIAKSRSYQLMNAAQVVNSLKTSTTVEECPPDNEEQVRPLTSLEPEAQRKAWRRAAETTPNYRPTARHILRVVREHQEQEHQGTDSALKSSDPARGCLESWPAAFTVA